MISEQMIPYYSIPASVVFPEAPNDFKYFKFLLQQLDVTDTLLLCACINLRVGASDTLSDQQQVRLIHQFFMPEQIDRMKVYARSISTQQIPSVFFRGQLLELMRWVCLFCPDLGGTGKTFEKLEARQTLVHACMIVTELWDKRVYNNLYDSSGNLIKPTKENTLGLLRRATSESSPAVDIIRAFGRGKSLFGERFSKHYPNFLEEFKTTTNLTLSEYYNCLFVIAATHISTLDTELTAAIFKLEALNSSPEFETRFLKFFKITSQTVDELRSNLWNNIVPTVDSFADVPAFDQRILRDKPILQTSNGLAIIMDAGFLMDKASVGPLFHLPEHKRTAAFTAYGHTFEDYACDLLEKMYPKSPFGLADRLSRNLRENYDNNIQVADASLIDVNQLILFEMKAVLIREAHLDDPNYTSLLKDKYQSKGEFQLARSIRKLTSGEWSVAELDLSSSPRIYPVLLAHDMLLNSMGNSMFFADLFKAALEPDETPTVGYMKRGTFRVTPLIIMTIDVLEDLEISVRNFNLCELLSDYSLACSNRADSLHSFIRMSNKYRPLMDSRGTVVRKAIELFQEIAHILNIEEIIQQLSNNELEE